MSWSTLACCFAPLLIINSLKQKVSEFLSLMMMVIPLIISFIMETLWTK